MSTTTDLQIREVTDADLPGVLELLEASLGWIPDDQYAAFFAWKHHDNPFGRSPGWVAVDGDRLAGLRVWLRWEFEDGDATHRAVRAVDTATHPDYRGRGVFRTLTMHGIEAMRHDGVDFVFNTPNEQSRPGYLKMGWRQVGRLPVSLRFASPAAAMRAWRARVPADKWSRPSDVGVPADAALADVTRIRALLDDRPTASGLRTRLTPQFLRWRYGFQPLHYRVLADDHGMVVFRLRRRGSSLECVVNAVLADDPGAERRLLRRLGRESGADHLMRIDRGPGWAAGFIPLPGQGPILTWREVTSTTMPPLARWDLGMGDVELF